MADLTLERGLQVLETRGRIVSYAIIAYMIVAAVMVLMTIGLLGGQISFDETVKLDTLSAFTSLAAVAYLGSVGIWDSHFVVDVIHALDGPLRTNRCPMGEDGAALPWQADRSRA